METDKNIAVTIEEPPDQELEPAPTAMLTEEEAKAFQPVLYRFLNDYANKSADTSDKVWLTLAYQRELSLSKEAAEQLSEETIASVAAFDNNMASLHNAVDSGINKETWFTRKIEEAAVGMSIHDYGNYLNGIDAAISTANAQMYRTIVTQDGGINGNFNLDGFLAEQYHVNSFNIKAALEKSPFRAKVCVPEPGQTYGKDSFDVVIENTNSGKIAHQYQLKFGKDAEATIKMLKSGDYRNQRIIVPEGQVEAVQKAFPTKSITSHLGGTDKVKVMSETLTKEGAKKMQELAQIHETIETVSWHSYATKSLAINISKNAMFSGMECAAVTVGFDLAKRVVTGEKFDKEETIALAIRSGADSGIKQAVVGALKVSGEKGLISLIPKGTPVGVIAQIACMGIEGIKSLYKVSTGEMTITEALDHMGRSACCMYVGASWGTVGLATGALACSFVPVIGPIVGGLVGGMIGYAAGSTFGNIIYDIAKEVGDCGRTVLKETWEGVKTIGRGVYNCATNLASKAADALGRAARWLF